MMLFSEIDIFREYGLATAADNSAVADFPLKIGGGGGIGSGAISATKVMRRGRRDYVSDGEFSLISPNLEGNGCEKRRMRMTDFRRWQWQEYPSAVAILARKDSAEYRVKDKRRSVVDSCLSFIKGKSLHGITICSGGVGEQADF